MLEYTIQVLFFGLIVYGMWRFATEDSVQTTSKSQKKTKKKTVKRKTTKKKN